MIPLMPACWTWTVTDEERAAARECPENFAHILLWNWQRGRCAFCGGKGVRLRRDHDHATGLSRGLLCSSCNGCEGLAAVLGVPGARTKDPHDSKGFRTWEKWQVKNTDLIELMKLYRATNPASMLGIRARHEQTISPRGILLPLEYVGPLPISHSQPPTGE